MVECDIVLVGKNRNGTPRYWCRTHHAPVKAVQGGHELQCQADKRVIIENDKNSLTINPTDYPGGVALWGAALAVYDTTQFDLDLGIHVHARKEAGKEKQIDETFRFVHVIKENEKVDFDYLAAISYLSSNMMDLEMVYLECPYCGYPHLDKDWFAIHPHKKHLCAHCGKNFYVANPNIGNPMMKAKALFGDSQIHRKLVMANRSIELKQRDFPYGISFWGSNAALLWTSSKTEEYGIHIHAYAENTSRPTIDETFDNVTIDGIHLDIEQIRRYMVQKTLPFLKDRVECLRCPECKEYFYDTEERSYTPSMIHSCSKCGTIVKTRKKVVASPVDEIIKRLQKSSELPLQKHDITEFYPSLQGW